METIINILSIDVEDYFQVSAFESLVDPRDWGSYEMRVECNIHKLLEMLALNGTQATFFVLGWVAESCPEIVKTIAHSGHEIASHGFYHRRVNTLSRGEFRQDIRASKMLLEDLTGLPVKGYRAPSFSITRDTLWAFDELGEAGYRYDSSIFPIHHDFYGISEWPRFAGWAGKTAENGWSPVENEGGSQNALFEVPITTLSLAGRKWPIAGGGYFRLFPYAVTRWGLRRINRRDGRPFTFYLHPWEIDPHQPRMGGASLKSRFRHYQNLHKTERRLKRLLRDFSFTSIAEAYGDQLG